MGRRLGWDGAGEKVKLMPVYADWIIEKWTACQLVLSNENKRVLRVDTHSSQALT